MKEILLTTDEFFNKSRQEQLDYIKTRLHLDQYSTITGDAVDDCSRVIGRVRSVLRNGENRYYIDPIDCQSGNFERGILFNDTRKDGIPLWDNSPTYRTDYETAAEAFKTKRFVSAEYRVCNSYYPLRVYQLRLVDCSMAELQEAINISEQLEGQKRELEAIRTRVEAQRGELEEIQARVEAENGELETLRQKARDTKNTARQFLRTIQSLGFRLPPAVEDMSGCDDGGDGLSDQPIAGVDELAAAVRNYLAGTCGLFYDRRVIREFLGAMFSRQLIILSGPPGTGKSSLPPAVARCIGAECRMVSVQPSWTDNQDLLGFYDPIRERFTATPFMEILVEAGMHPETIYLVCLDEMNLVRVEYYFSEILSAMETWDKKLRLYSPNAYGRRQKALAQQISQEFAALPADQWDQWLAEHKNDPARQPLLEKWNELCRYPAEFPIPENVQFIGTLNMDESTKGLSPKVLDRSFIIEVLETGDPPEAEGNPPQPEALSWTAFRDMQGDSDAAEEALQELKELVKQLSGLGGHSAQVSLSRRGQAQARELLRRGLSVDDVLLGKILPAVKYLGLDLEQIAGLPILRQKDRYAMSLDKLERMYDPELQELDYWR